MRACPRYLAGLLAVLWLLVKAGSGAPVAAAPEDETSPEVEAVLYHPDLLGDDLSELARRFERYFDEELEPLLGLRLTLRYFAKIEDFDDYLAQCRQSNRWPLYGSLPVSVATELDRDIGLRVVAYPVTQTGVTTHELLLLARRDSGVAAVSELAGRRLLTPRHWAHDRRPFERAVFGGELGLDDMGELAIAPSSMSALMGLMYREADAAVVSSRVFESMRNRAARIWRKVVVLHRSPPEGLSLIVAFPPATAEQVELLRRAAARTAEAPSGRAWLEYLYLRSLEPADWTSLPWSRAARDESSIAPEEAQPRKQ